MQRACFACLHDLFCFSNRMSDATEQMIRQEHLFIVVCGTDDSDKGSTIGRLLFELDGTSKREPDGPTLEAERLEKLFLATALYMEDLKGKTERGGIPVKSMSPVQENSFKKWLRRKRRQQHER